MYVNDTLIIIGLVALLVIGFMTNKKWVKLMFLSIAFIGLILFWYIMTLGIIKAYPIVNNNGEIVSMMTPITSRAIKQDNWISTFKSRNGYGEDVKFYRTWKKNWLKIGMWSSYINDVEYWELDYLEISDK
jgi:hypothetical protein